MSGPETIELQVENLTCPDCLAKLEKGVAKVPGVETVACDLTSGRMTARVDPGRADANRLIHKVGQLGYTAYQFGSDRPELSFLSRYRLHLLTAASGTAWIVATVLSQLGLGEPWVIALFALGIALAFTGVARQTVGSIRQLSLDMNVLMFVAVIGAMILGEWSEGAMVIFLFALAELIESYSLHRANRAIESLMDLAPDTVRLVQGDAEHIVSPAAVPIGSILRVNPGERIGLDGEVTAGRSAVNQAPVTGESLPAAKQPGDPVFAGTVNGQGALVIRTFATAGQSTVARIINLVRDAQAAKAPSHRFIDAFTRVYTPIVFAVAVAVTLVPVLVLSLPFADWFYRSLVLLLVACPCAFVIATPVTLVSGLTAAARSGVLIKGGAAMEKAAGIKAFAFDKTGTLTVGRPHVVDVVALNDADEPTLVGLAAAVERHTGHVLGQAIDAYARERGLDVPTALNVQLLPGLGAKGTVDGREIFVGSHRFFHDSDLCSDELHAKATGLQGAAKTMVFVASKRRPKGVIILADALRDGARESLADLRSAGIEHLAMLTGDNPLQAQAIGRALDLDEIHADRMPDQKVEALKEIRRQHGAVAMVGDGINDAPALATADLGIAMGAGSDQALETADAALVSGRLARLAMLVRLSRKTLRRVKANTAIALGIKSVFLVAAVLGVATLWMAIFADMGASLIVIANGVRLLRYKDKPGR